ncbi:hypothetical protein F4U02_04845 [Acinetobacter haemolyticus]|uniref:Uncharacterized protein n=1 Tax=Acinetobacter haemolyticus ATCC 19194 TaxID=707232 RepID=D4XRJ1_ACIHA|nr:hypothetical protein HMP0015_2333 [Acinetobacter haemolyticus ATCC 19194]MQZ30332.1 hypothetical protein [Acinetobacter haemolyticus]
MSTCLNSNAISNRPLKLDCKKAIANTIDFISRLIHLKTIFLNKLIEIGLCNKAVPDRNQILKFIFMIKTIKKSAQTLFFNKIGID